MKTLVTALIAILLCFNLTACTHQSANATDIEKAVAFCGGSDKIEYIEIIFSGDETVKCKNGNRTNLDGFKLSN